MKKQEMQRKKSKKTDEPGVYAARRQELQSKFGLLMANRNQLRERLAQVEGSLGLLQGQLIEVDHWMSQQGNGDGTHKRPSTTDPQILEDVPASIAGQGKTG